GEGPAGDRAAEALVQSDGAIGAVLAHVDLEPVVADMDPEVVGEAVFHQRVGAAQVSVVIAKVAPVRVQVLSLHGDTPALAARPIARTSRVAGAAARTAGRACAAGRRVATIVPDASK